MKIKEVTSEHILFDNGSEITFDHDQDCCEDNYADFEQIEEAAWDCEFPESLLFEKVDGSGFRFGGHGTYMFFVPCYSEQNGYYTTDIDIYFNGKQMINLECKEVLDGE